MNKPMKPIEGMKIDDRSIVIFRSMKQIQEHGLLYDTIRKVIRGELQTHRGWIFRNHTED